MSETAEEEKDEVLKMLRKSKCDLFATKDTLEEARTYAIVLLKSSSAEEREWATNVVLGIYHNTLVQLFIGSMESE